MQFPLFSLTNTNLSVVLSNQYESYEPAVKTTPSYLFPEVPRCPQYPGVGHSPAPEFRGHHRTRGFSTSPMSILRSLQLVVMTQPTSDHEPTSDHVLGSPLACDLHSQPGSGSANVLNCYDLGGLQRSLLFITHADIAGSRCDTDPA